MSAYIPNLYSKKHSSDNSIPSNKTSQDYVNGKKVLSYEEAVNKMKMMKNQKLNPNVFTQEIRPKIQEVQKQRVEKQNKVPLKPVHKQQIEKRHKPSIAIDPLVKEIRLMTTDQIKERMRKDSNFKERYDKLMNSESGTQKKTEKAKKAAVYRPTDSEEVKRLELINQANKELEIQEKLQRKRYRDDPRESRGNSKINYSRKKMLYDDDESYCISCNVYHKEGAHVDRATRQREIDEDKKPTSRKTTQIFLKTNKTSKHNQIISRDQAIFIQQKLDKVYQRETKHELPPPTIPKYLNSSDQSIKVKNRHPPEQKKNDLVKKRERYRRMVEEEVEYEESENGDEDDNLDDPIRGDSAKKYKIRLPVEKRQDEDIEESEQMFDDEAEEN